MNRIPPKVLLIGGVVIMLLIMLAGLRRQVNNANESNDLATQQADADDGNGSVSLHKGSARIGKLGSDTDKREPRTYKASKSIGNEINEEFEAQKLRALGDSHISGHVFSRSREIGFKPIDGANVYLYENDPNTTHPPLRTTMTDKQGSFTISNISDGNRRFVLVTKATGFAPDARFVILRGEPAGEFIGLEKGVELRGVVRDTVTSQGVADAAVIHPNNGRDVFGVLGVTTTTITGEFYFPDCGEGHVITMASANGYISTKARLNSPANNAMIPLAGGGAKIKGVTIDRLTQKPQGGAKVWAIDNNNDTRVSALSQADGTFEISGLPGSSYEVYAIHGMKSDSQTIDLKDNETHDDTEIVLPSQLFVSGKVVNANKGGALPGVKVWYQSPSGKSSTNTDQDGRFAFETMAIDDYTLLIHEKGFLPVSDKHTTGVKETLDKKVAKNQASDEILIRLKQVPAISGTVTNGDVRSGRGMGSRNRGGSNSSGATTAGGSGGKGVSGATVASAAGGTASEKNLVPVSGAQVTVDYLIDKDYQRVETRSDALGNFFVNLPERKRGDAKVIAMKNNSIDAKSMKVPNKKPIILKIKRQMATGQVLLADKTEMDGVKIEIAHFLPDKAPADRAIRIKETDVYTMRGGRFYLPLPDNEQVELRFFFPDGVQVSKTFDSSKLLKSQSMFLYDPSLKDVIVDTSRQSSGGGWGGGRGGNRGGTRTNATP